MPADGMICDHDLHIRAAPKKAGSASGPHPCPIASLPSCIAAGSALAVAEVAMNVIADSTEAEMRAGVCRGEHSPVAPRPPSRLRIGWM